LFLGKLPLLTLVTLLLLSASESLIFVSGLRSVYWLLVTAQLDLDVVPETSYVFNWHSGASRGFVSQIAFSRSLLGCTPANVTFSCHPLLLLSIVTLAMTPNNVITPVVCISLVPRYSESEIWTPATLIEYEMSSRKCLGCFLLLP
jgi:hypothetical protein